jgi:hypothetical protein
MDDHRGFASSAMAQRVRATLTHAMHARETRAHAFPAHGAMQPPARAPVASPLLLTRAVSRVCALTRRSGAA